MKRIIKSITDKTNLSDQEAWWLIEAATNKKRVQLLSIDQLTSSEQKQIDQWIYDITTRHKPLSYILGSIPFLNIDLDVKPPTLIPRPETEEWTNEVIKMIESAQVSKLNICDIGTGSGCIALSLAKAFPLSQVYALDISQDAIELAKNNAKKNEISNITFIQSNLFENLPKEISFDVIVSNPPYINPKVQLDRSVTDWEDHQALFAPQEGLQIIEKIIEQSHHFLKKDSKLPYQLIIETDIDQGERLKSLFKSNRYSSVSIKKDMFNKDRTAWAKF